MACNGRATARSPCHCTPYHLEGRNCGLDTVVTMRIECHPRSYDACSGKWSRFGSVKLLYENDEKKWGFACTRCLKMMHTCARMPRNSRQGWPNPQNIHRKSTKTSGPYCGMRWRRRI